MLSRRTRAPLTARRRAGKPRRGCRTNMLNALVTRVGHFARDWREVGPSVHGQLPRASERFRAASSARRRDAVADDVAAAIGTDERRMHVRAYNYWVSLLDGRDFPSIEDLEPGDVQDFAPHSVLLDFTCGRDNPGDRLISAPRSATNAGSTTTCATIADVPSRSLLSRLTDHYMQIIANRAPIGFEAEFVNQRGENDLLPRHPDALLVGRRHDRLHLRRDQLEARRRGAEPPHVDPVAELPPGCETAKRPPSRVEPAEDERRSS